MKAIEYRRTTEDTVYIGIQDSTWSITAINPIIDGILKRGTVHTNVDASSIREIDISAPIDAATGETLIIQSFVYSITQISRAFSRSITRQQDLIEKFTKNLSCSRDYTIPEIHAHCKLQNLAEFQIKSLIMAL